MNFILEMGMNESVGSEYFFDVFVKVHFLIGLILKVVKFNDERK